MPVTVVVGTQWGDEGKGKLVDILSKDYDLCARFNGGANAGHTVVADGHIGLAAAVAEVMALSVQLLIASAPISVGVYPDRVWLS